MPKVAAKDREAFVEARRDEILAAAVRVIAERGYALTSMAAIADAVHLSKGTLYLYFESKDALLEALLKRYSLRPVVEAAFDALAREPLAEQPLEEIVRRIVRVCWQGLEARRELVLLALRELPSQLEAGSHFVSQVLAPVSQRFAALLAEKLGPERARRLDLTVVARSLVGSVGLFYATQTLLGGDRILPTDPERALDTLVELFVNGLTGAGDA